MSHVLAIAKASFAAALIKPDPFPLSRDEITSFHQQLEELLALCSPANIQRCKGWLLENVIPSSGRTFALGKFIIAFSRSLTTTQATRDGPGTVRGPQTQRMQMHLLYLLHDVFHNTKYHSDSQYRHDTMHTSLQACIKPLVAAICLPGAADQCILRLNELLELWQSHKHVNNEFAQELRNIAKGQSPKDETVDLSPKPGGPDDKKEAPFIMPASHGDVSTPFYDLPASNFVPHIIPDSTSAIDPRLIKPLQFAPGPADRELVTALKSFLNEVEMMDNIDPAAFSTQITDIDALGQYIAGGRGRVYVATHSYYGWSREYCQAQRRPYQGRSLTQLTMARTPSYSPEARNKSLSRSYSPPSTSAYRGAETSPPSAMSQTLSRRSPPRDPRRPPPLPKPESCPSSSAPIYTSIQPQGRQLSPQISTFYIPPRPPGYHGPWPPPPPPPHGATNIQVDGFQPATPTSRSGH